MWGNLIRNAAALATESAQNIVGNLDEIASKASNLLETLDQGIGNEEENVDNAGEESPQDFKDLSSDSQEEVFYADKQQINKSDFSRADELNDSILNISHEFNVEEHDHYIPHKSDVRDTVSDIASIQSQVGDIKGKHEKLLKSATALDSGNQKIYLELSAQYRTMVEKYKAKREECKHLESELQLKNNDLMLAANKLNDSEKHLQQLMDQNAHLSSFVAEVEIQRDEILQQLQNQREENRRQVDTLKLEKKVIMNCLSTLEESLPEEGVVGISEDDLLEKVDTSDEELRDLIERLVYKFMASALYSEKNDEKYKTAMEKIFTMENELAETKPMVESLSIENEKLRNELALVKVENNSVQVNEENLKEIQGFKEDIQRLEEEVEALQIEKKMIQEAFDGKVEDYEATIVELRQAVAEADEKVQEIEETMSNLREEMQSKIHTLENAKSEEGLFESIHSEAKIKSLSEEIEIIKVELKMMETENYALKAQLESFHHERIVHETDIKHRNASIVKLEDELTLAKEKQHKLMEEIMDLGKEKSLIQHQLQESLDAIAKTIDNAEKLKDKCSSLDEENKKLSEYLSHLQSIENGTAPNNDETNEELKATKHALEEKSQRLEELEWEHGDAQSRIVEFEQLVARLISELSSTQNKQMQLEEELDNVRLAIKYKEDSKNEENKNDSESAEKTEVIVSLEKLLVEAHETIETLRKQLSNLETQRDEAQQQELKSTENDDNEENERLKIAIEELVKEKEAMKTAMEQLQSDISTVNPKSQKLLANDQMEILQREVQSVSERLLASEAIVLKQKSRIEQLNEEIVQLLVTCEQSTSAVQDKTTMVANLTEELSLITEERKIVDERLLSLREEISQSETLLQDKQQEIVKLQAALNSVNNAENEELISLKASLDNVQALNKKCEQSIANLQEELEHEREMRNSSIAKLEELLQSEANTASYLKEELQHLHERYRDEVERSKNFVNEVDSLKSDKANLEAQLSEVTATANQSLLEYQKTLEKENVQSNQQIFELTSIAEKRNKEILELQEHLEDVLSHKSEAERQVHELQEKLSLVSEENIVAEEKILFLQQEMINVQSTLAAKDDDITRLKTLCGDATRFECEYQAALQALEAKNKEISELEAQFDLFSAHKEKDHTIQLHAKEVEIAALSEQIQSLQDALRSQEASWMTTTQSKTEECLSLAAQVQSLQESVSSLRQEAETRAQQQYLLEAAYAEAQLKTVALETSQETWKHNAQEIQETLLRLQDAYDALVKKEMPELQTANSTLSEEVTFLQQEQRRLVIENDHFCSRISQLEQSLQTIQKDLQQAQQKLHQALSWETRATQAENQLKKLDNKKKKDLEMLKKQNEKINLLQQELYVLRGQQHQHEEHVSMPPTASVTTKTYSEAEFLAQENVHSQKVKALQEECEALQKEVSLKQVRCDSLERQLLQLEKDFVTNQDFVLEARKQEITFLEQDVTEWKAKAETVIGSNSNNSNIEEQQVIAQQQSQSLRFFQTQIQELQLTIQIMREQHAQALQDAQDKAQALIAGLHKETSHWKRENVRLMEDVHRLEQKLNIQQDMHNNHNAASNNYTVSENNQNLAMDMEAGNYVSP